jgi:hypothetical protein
MLTSCKKICWRICSVIPLAILIIAIGLFIYHDAIAITWLGIAQAFGVASALVLCIAWIIFCDKQMKTTKKPQDFEEGWQNNNSISDDTT